MEIRNQTVQMQVDTGVSYNVFYRRCLLTTTEIGRTKAKLVTYSKSKLSLLGTVTESVPGNRRNYMDYTVEFVIVGDGFTALLGAEASHKIDHEVIQHQNILSFGK